jgi:hypothetical protein
MVLGAVVLAGALLSKLEPARPGEQSAGASWLPFGGGSKRDETAPPVTNHAREYLEQAAAKGDATAQQVLAATARDEAAGDASGKFDEAAFEASFRLDLSSDGLLATLNMMLQAKRREERMLRQMLARRSVLLPDQQLLDDLAAVAREKGEIKARIKALQRRRR